MAKILVRHCSGQVLNWLVAKAEGYQPVFTDPGQQASPLFIPGRAYKKLTDLTYCTDPALAIPIIERELISVDAGDGQYPAERKWAAWLAKDAPVNANDEVHGPTFLIAAMRCYAVSKLGSVAEVPLVFAMEGAKWP